MADNALVVNLGTQLVMASDDLSSVHYPRLKIALGGDGTNLGDFTGTLAAVTSVANLVGGTVTKLEGGTVGLVTRTGNVGTVESGSVVVTKGTISNGTMLPFGILHTTEFDKRAGTTGTALGTLIPGTASTVYYITRLVISVGTGSNVVIASGGTATPIAGTYFLNQNGGVALMPINPPLRVASGSALVFQQTSTGSITIECAGYSV